jgi:hypothetical protein
MTRPQKDAIAHLDWVLSCGMKSSGEPCTSPASHWVGYHHVGACKHPSLDEYGCHSTWVCQGHLRILEAKAVRVARYYNPPRWMAWLTSRKPLCPTCGIPVQNETDVLQERMRLWQ